MATPSAAARTAVPCRWGSLATPQEIRSRAGTRAVTSGCGHVAAALSRAHLWLDDPGEAPRRTAGYGGTLAQIVGGDTLRQSRRCNRTMAGIAVFSDRRWRPAYPIPLSRVEALGKRSDGVDDHAVHRSKTNGGSGSHVTRRWREVDPNFRFRVRNLGVRLERN